MSEQYTLFLARKHRGEDDGDRRCIVVEPVSPSLKGKKTELMLAIYGPDESATEFLKRKQFEELVANARRIMGWEGPQ
jgi:hypothetical protein